MNVFIITQDCCGEYVSAWDNLSDAQNEVNRLNEEYRRSYGRDNYSVEADDLRHSSPFA